MLKTKDLFKNAGIYLIFFGMMCATQAAAQENPDELYRQGRFAEAEKAYALSDMDHPKDIRYRYNRGCAAYQGADYQGAMAAFSSVLRRAEDKNIKFKAAFNLGNSAYKQGDFESAAGYYKQSLSHNPGNENARYNLELALRALEKQKKEKSESQDEQRNGEKDQKGASSDSKDKKGKSEHPDREKGPRKEKSDAADRQSQQDKEGAGQKKDAHEGKENSQKEGLDSETPKNLDGNLKPLRQMAEKQDEKHSQEQADSTINQRKAEALLDNITEDRSRMMRFYFSKEKKQGVASGKDW